MVTMNSNKSVTARFAFPLAVTKSGTNELHGSAFYNYNGNALNARDFFADSTPFRVYNNFGGGVGGLADPDFSSAWIVRFVVGRSGSLDRGIVARAAA